MHTYLLQCGKFLSRSTFTAGYDCTGMTHAFAFWRSTAGDKRGYRFTDFMKVGIPLNLSVGLLASALIPVFWPL